MRHPLSEPINRATNDWIRRFELMPDDPAAQQRHEEYGWFTGRTYPHASREVLEVATYFVAWLFLADDQLDETDLGRELDRVASLHARFGAVLSGASPRPDDAKLTHALHDVRTRFVEIASPAWVDRFCHDTIGYFEANRWECENRRRQHIPSLAEYIAMRPYTGAVIPCFDIILLTNAIDLPERIHDHPLVEATLLTANRIICYSNDILSLSKEIRHGDVYNLVILIQHEQGCSREEAIARATRLHDAELATYLDLERSLTSFEAPIATQLASLTAGLRAWIRANYDWSERAARYKDVSAA
ncbi:terpene synthase family protein [Chondromyces apiculatus]|uniref:Terpene synthase n=1 Tax=Chondromyces apiculatus DSM 436 TaxID=1192034 RepID=A0A017SW31_9BACT|nr:hypothetical protein [Chondromyces apiculatus]EYF00967.1 Terpene synthase, metal-binding domain protein [Chondromyces apiculatus DSM 436]